MPRALLLLIGLVACSGRTLPPPARHSSIASDDSAFRLMQARGHTVMGVDQYTSPHRFESLPDGGRIALQRDQDDSGGTARIRTHMRTIAAAFAAGDFTLPGQVHDQEVPGTAIMTALRRRITYTADTLARGGSVRIQSRDSSAIAAVHRFLAFQRQAHRTAHDAGAH